jgi:hypothetical protein
LLSSSISNALINNYIIKGHPNILEEKQKDRDTSIKIAKIAAITGITSAILTAIVGLVIGFEACK